MQPSRYIRPLVICVALFVLTTLLPSCATSPDVSSSPAERAKVQIVNDFMAAWDDPDRAVDYLAPIASIRMIEDQPPIVGREAIAAAFKAFMTPGVTLTVETLETMVRGPVVMNKRIDTLITNGKPDQVFNVVGVFVVKEGKITEWTDYVLK